jgi:hypothetical protein
VCGKGVLLALAATLLVPALAPAQADPDDNEGPVRVAVFEPSAPGDDSRYDAVAGTIAETIAINLRILGDYEVVEPEQSSPETAEAALSLLTRQRIDNAVYGTLAVDELGTIEIELSVYDRHEESIQLTEQVVATGYLEVFDATDRLVTAMLEAFSDRHIAYGRLELEPTGGPGGYDVYLDGKRIGSSVRSLQRLLTGDYVLTIEQTRLSGPETLLERNISVREDEVTRVEFPIPQMTRGEYETLLELDALTMRQWATFGQWSTGGWRTEWALERAVELTAKARDFSPIISRAHSRYRSLLELYETRAGDRESRRLHRDLYDAAVSGSEGDDPSEDRFVPATFPSSIVNTLPTESEETRRSRSPWVVTAHADTQVGGGATVLFGLNLGFLRDHIQLSLLFGPGYAAETERILAAAGQRLSWALFNTTLTPTLSVYSSQVSDFSGIAVIAGPSLGFHLRLARGTIYLENYFAVDALNEDIMGWEFETINYLPAFGIIL